MMKKRHTYVNCSNKKYRLFSQKIKRLFKNLKDKKKLKNRKGRKLAVVMKKKTSRSSNLRTTFSHHNHQKKNPNQKTSRRRSRALLFKRHLTYKEKDLVTSSNA